MTESETTIISFKIPSKKRQGPQTRTGTSASNPDRDSYCPEVCSGFTKSPDDAKSVYHAIVRADCRLSMTAVHLHLTMSTNANPQLYMVTKFHIIFWNLSSSYSDKRNRPWRPTGLWAVKGPTLSTFPLEAEVNWYKSFTSSGIEIATFRVVAQFLNHYTIPYPPVHTAM
jgi:hypothetical protein